MNFNQLQNFATILGIHLEQNFDSINVHMPKTKYQEEMSFLDKSIDEAYNLMKNWQTFNELKRQISKKDIEQFIRTKIGTDYRWSIKTLLLLYKNQTVEERRVEQTVQNNAVGFTGWDSKLMTSFAKQYISRCHQKHNKDALDANLLSTKQLEIVKSSMKKYWKQVYNNSDELKLLQQIAKERNSVQLTMNII
jgi:hypothetical protein